MAFRSRFLIEPGTKVSLGELDTGCAGRHDKDRTKERTRRIVCRLAELQYLLYANARGSLLVVLQGPDASGKDGLIRHVFGGLNPLGVKVTPFGEPNAAEAKHDFLWRVHRRAPANGEIAVFNRSHYEGILVERVRKLVPRSEWKQRYGAINAFEDLLAQNGTRVIKFYLHISADEQLERFRRRLEDKRRRWKIAEADYTDRALWKIFEEAGNDMLERTSTAGAPWYVIPSDQKWYRSYAIARIVLLTLKDLHLTVPPVKVDIGNIRKEFHAEAGG